ncbi:prolipoprotein diacylglyceryl transferase [Pseudactinotalea sp.]|uniref:prolipoprotein diacylglyceryl transferase n=1 Tax=Pseudactinotalea sp. TaxID=1926260 RepID=UPI003B3B2BD1
MNGIPSPAQGVWYLGPIPLRAYAIAILAGIVIGAWIANKRYRSRGGPEGALIDAVMWAVPFGIVGARIYHVLSSPDRYFGPDGNLALALRIWEGGLGIWGAIPAGALGAWISLRRAGLRLTPLADAIAPALLVAQAIGRLGNYFNQELFGAPTTLPWGLQIDQAHLRAQGLDFAEGTLFHPTFLYELLWNVAMAVLIIYLDRRFALRHGRVFWLYVALYTLGRGWIEMLRIDEAEQVLGLRLNVWTSIIVLLVAVAAFVIIGRRTRGVEDPIWIPGREPEAEADEDEAEPDEADVVEDEESREPDDPLVDDADSEADQAPVDDDDAAERPDSRLAD